MKLAGIAGTTGFPGARLRVSPRKSDMSRWVQRELHQEEVAFAGDIPPAWRASYTAKDAESRQKGWLRILGPKFVDNAIYCDVCKCPTLTKGERRFIPLPLKLPPRKLQECGRSTTHLISAKQPSRIDISEGVQSQKSSSKLAMPCRPRAAQERGAGAPGEGLGQALRGEPTS